MSRLLSILLLLCAALSVGVRSAAAETPTYLVGHGDVLQIVVYGEDELSGSFPVDAAGMVDLPLLGRVNVAGQTLEQVSQVLLKRLGADYLVDPKVRVQVEKFASQPVRVLGAVRKPGTYFLEGSATLLDILSLAGGVLADKSSRELAISRDGAVVEVVDLEQLLSSGAGDLQLQSGDVINVREGVFVYVSGQVAKPGAVGWWGGLTVTEALTEAGGPTKIANLRKAHIMRGSTRIPVNLRRIVKGQDADPELLAGDQLYVEESSF